MPHTIKLAQRMREGDWVELEAKVLDVHRWKLLSGEAVLSGVLADPTGEIDFTITAADYHKFEGSFGVLKQLRVFGFVYMAPAGLSRVIVTKVEEM